VEALLPTPGEDATLLGEVGRLGHADALRSAAGSAREALTGDEDGDGPDALALLTAARRALELVAEHDVALAELAARSKEAALLAADLAQDLASYLGSVDADPARLAAAHERLAALSALARRLGVEGADGLLLWASTSSDRLLALDGADDQVRGLVEEQEVLAADLGLLAAELSDARGQAATRFGEAVTAELRQLAMPHAVVTARLSQRPDEDGLAVEGTHLHAGPSGVDEVEILLEPHPGAPAGPLAKSASGGELSRVMLAVEVVFAGADPVPIMVFDEVDAGVGGAAAVEIGRCLARLATTHQVIVVTHLPQVAAFADRHLHVVKTTQDGALTSGGVTVLEGESRIAELSRMMAGLDSGLARAHAEELLEQAQASR
jgi:DNA repair protein RecN (Recombination protein N)